MARRKTLSAFALALSMGIANPSPHLVAADRTFRSRAGSGSAAVAASHSASSGTSQAEPTGVLGSSSAVSNPAPDLAELEKMMLDLINRERLDPANREELGGHARPLQWDDKLAEVARAHSQDMAARHYFDHFSPDGSFPAQRVTQAGIVWLATGENIAKFADVARAEAAFMNEPRFQANHRSNILSPDFTHVGIGIARGDNGLLYITQEFVQKP
jgi:uncharacterized protein YkwD